MPHTQFLTLSLTLVLACKRTLPLSLSLSLSLFLSLSLIFTQSISLFEKSWSELSSGIQHIVRLLCANSINLRPKCEFRCMDHAIIDTFC